MDQKTIDAVWAKATYFNNNGVAKDECGALIKYKDYGKRTSKYGWEIDHINSQSGGGSNNLSNLRPLHWQNNVDKSNGRLNLTSPKVKAFKTEENGTTWDNAEKRDDGKYYWL